jgi:hypothetical protein
MPPTSEKCWAPALCAHQCPEGRQSAQAGAPVAHPPHLLHRQSAADPRRRGAGGQSHPMPRHPGRRRPAGRSRRSSNLCVKLRSSSIHYSDGIGSSLGRWSNTSTAVNCARPMCCQRRRSRLTSPRRNLPRHLPDPRRESTAPFRIMQHCGEVDSAVFTHRIPAIRLHPWRLA